MTNTERDKLLAQYADTRRALLMCTWALQYIHFAAKYGLDPGKRARASMSAEKLDRQIETDRLLLAALESALGDVE